MLYSLVYIDTFKSMIKIPHRGDTNSMTHPAPRAESVKIHSFWFEVIVSYKKKIILCKDSYVLVQMLYCTQLYVLVQIVTIVHMSKFILIDELGDFWYKRGLSGER